MALETPAPLDSASPSETFTGVPAATDVPAHDLYAGLQAELRKADATAGNLLLQRYLKRPTELLDRLAQKTWKLTHMHDPAAVPAETLEDLRAICGFGPKSGFPDAVWSRLDTAHKRKLLQAAVPYWKRRGRKDALSDAIRSLTGVRPQIDDWFYVRWILDEVLLGVSGLPGADPWILWESASSVPAGVADGSVRVSLRVPDETGTLDRQLVQDLCSLARPLSERYEIAYVDFLDTFADKLLGHWAGSNAEWVAADSTAKALAGLKFGQAGARVVAQTPLSATWTKTHLFLILRFENANQQEVRIQFYDQHPAATAYYALLLNTLTKEVKLQRYVAPVLATLQTVNVGGLLDVPSSRGVRIDVDKVGAGNNQIRFYIDGDLVLTDATDSTYTQGTFAVHVPGGFTNRVYLHRAESYQKPLATVTLAA